MARDENDEIELTVRNSVVTPGGQFCGSATYCFFFFVMCSLSPRNQNLSNNVIISYDAAGQGGGRAPPGDGGGGGEKSGGPRAERAGPPGETKVRGRRRAVVQKLKSHVEPREARPFPDSCLGLVLRETPVTQVKLRL